MAFTALPRYSSAMIAWTNIEERHAVKIAQSDIKKMNADYPGKTILTKRPPRRIEISEHRIQLARFASRLFQISNMFWCKTNKSDQALQLLVNAHHGQTVRSESHSVTAISTSSIEQRRFRMGRQLPYKAQESLRCWTKIGYALARCDAHMQCPIRFATRRSRRKKRLEERLAASSPERAHVCRPFTRLLSSATLLSRGRTSVPPSLSIAASAIRKMCVRLSSGLPRLSSTAICCGRAPLQLGDVLAPVPQRCSGKLVDVPNRLKSLG